MATRAWVAFFSQTGSEIANLSEKLGRWPDLIITNRRPENSRVIDSRIPNHLLRSTANRPELHELIWLLEKYSSRDLITLHGWLRIMPSDICNQFNIVNGHPGLITKYPELKGKDPQDKCWKLNHETAGCVIHKVTEGVDEGEVLASKEFACRLLSYEQLMTNLYKTSFDLWHDFIQKELEL